MSNEGKAPFDRNAYRRAMHWLAKPVTTVRVRVEGETINHTTVRKYDEKMRPWISDEAIAAAHERANKANAL